MEQDLWCLRQQVVAIAAVAATSGSINGNLWGLIAHLSARLILRHAHIPTRGVLQPSRPLVCSEPRSAALLLPSHSIHSHAFVLYMSAVRHYFHFPLIHLATTNLTVLCCAVLCCPVACSSPGQSLLPQTCPR